MSSIEFVWAHVVVPSCDKDRGRLFPLMKPMTRGMYRKIMINTVSEPTQFQSLKSSKILDALGAEAHRAHKWPRSLAMTSKGVEYLRDPESEILRAEFDAQVSKTFEHIRKIKFLFSKCSACWIDKVKNKLFLTSQHQDPGKATEAPPSQKFRRELQEVAPCASRLYEAVARPGQLSRQVEEWLGWVRTLWVVESFFFYVIVIDCH